MFQLLTGRHRLGATGEHANVALQQRILALEAELTKYKALAERRATVIKALTAGIAVLTLTSGLALSIHTAPVAQIASRLSRGFGVANTVSDFEAAKKAYQQGNYAHALRLLPPLADVGDPNAQSLLGLMYYHGHGVKRDDSQAAKWFRRAADQGQAEAQFYLGVMSAEGQGAPQDYAEAVKWYRLAAEQGEPRAQYNLGVSYAEGYGVAENNVAAYMWFNLAAARFPPSEPERRRVAISNRDLTASRMSREQVIEAQRLSSEWKPK
jgi:hypothetical protein